MAFSNRQEIRTFAALNRSLGPRGFFVSQKVRVIDCVEAAARTPEANAPVGPTAVDYLLPMLRKAAGPFGPDHPWLQEGDWRYAMSAHFDFVVHAPLYGQHPTHPLFVVEFDGATTHTSAAARRRDLAKNRLCAASGLPMVRINDTFLHSRERLTLVDWLAEMWAAYQEEMPRLIIERDEDLASMADEEKEEAGPWLMMEYPHLDVEMIFRLTHPFPPAVAIAQRLADKHGFIWSEGPKVTAGEMRRWRASSWKPPLPSLEHETLEQWHYELTLSGPDGETAEIRGVASVPGAYPLYEDRDVPEDGLVSLLERGQFQHLPAGPWSTASQTLGHALCVHNTLIEVEHYLRRHDKVPNL